MMEIVITMAGFGSRFRRAGYQLPKYQIEAHGRPLFDWSMLSLQGFDCCNPHYCFLVRGEDRAEGFIHQRCEQLGIRHFDLVELDQPTDGQATTALLAAQVWDPKQPLLIYNIDTYVEPGWMNASALRGDGFIPCFCGEGDHWSFVRLDETGRAAEVREKVRISQHCTLGAYYFRTAGLYQQLYHSYYTQGGEQNLEMGERYVAPLYNHLIQLGGEVYIDTIPQKVVHILGTPQELEVFLGEGTQ